MNKKYLINLGVAVVLFSGTLYGMQNCAPGFLPLERDQFMAVADIAGVKYQQIERLGRPGINEALVLSNDKLIAFNSIGPDLDLAVSNATVLEVLKEASAALDLFDSLAGGDNFGNGFDSQVVAGFLPDVMRIDTSKVIPVGTAGYTGDLILVDGTQAAMLTGGRKLEDDVIDITLNYLVLANPAGPLTDGVSYEGAAGNAAQGHKKLNGQTAYNGPATFPFLALPN
ncbi:MAG: DUF4331 family protein [Bdellovibrionota bacterium]